VEGVTRRRLGKVLLRPQADQVQDLGHGERLDLLHLFRFAVLCLCLFVDDEETGETQRRTRGAEQVRLLYLRPRQDFDADGVVQGRRHLAGDKTPPDQVVEPELVAAQMGLHRRGRAQYAGRADGFVRFLRG